MVDSLYSLTWRALRRGKCCFMERLGRCGRWRGLLCMGRSIALMSQCGRFRTIEGRERREGGVEEGVFDFLLLSLG